jgi:hypothetical protein
VAVEADFTEVEDFVEVVDFTLGEKVEPSAEGIAEAVECGSSQVRASHVGVGILLGQHRARRLWECVRIGSMFIPEELDG